MFRAAGTLLKLLEEQGLTQQNIRQQLSKALSDYNAGQPYESCCWLCDVLQRDDQTGDMVFEMGGKMYLCAYEISGEGDTRGTVLHMSGKQEVMPRTVYDFAEGTTVLERQIGKGERDQAHATDFAGKNKSFPILKPEDVMAAVHSMGRAGADNYDSETLKKNIMRIAMRKGFGDQLPKDWTKKTSESAPATGQVDEVELMEAEQEGATPNYGNVIRIQEAGAVGLDGTVKVKLISPGWGSSGYYSRETLKQAAKDRVFPKGMKMYWNHQTPAEEAARPEGDLNDLASILQEDATWKDDGPKGPGLYSTAKAYESYAKHIDDLSEDIGLSIRAWGQTSSGKAEGRTGTIVEKLTRGKSVDYVTTPGAGGAILQLFEAARPARTNPPPAAEETQEGQNMTDAEKAELTRLQEAAATSASETRKLKERLALSDARTLVTEALAGQEAKALHQTTKTRLLADLVRSAPMTEAGDLDKAKFEPLIKEAIKNAADEMAAIIGAGRVTGNGSVRESAVTEIKAEDAAKEMEARFRGYGLSEAGAKAAAEGRAA